MTLARSLAIVAVVAAGLSALVGIAYGGPDALITLVLLLVPGAGALVLAHAAAGRRRRLGRLRRQVELTVGIAVGQLLITLIAGAALMFFSTHDAVLALVIVTGAAVVALRTAQLLAAALLADVDRLQATLVAVGEGTREPAPMPASDDELASLTRAANATIARLADAERGRRDLIAAVSHDLRTPLTSLRLLAEAVEDGVVGGEDRARYLSQMRIHVGVLSGLIDDLFELSRLEAGDVRFTLEPVPVDDLLVDAVDAMRMEADARMVEVRAHLPEAVPSAHGDAEQLQRVLFNLMQNAIRHTPADGSVTVSAEATADRVEVEVADTGPGIPAVERGRVFEPFFRGGAGASRTGEGAGLGLAIARAIVEAHGGLIWLEDAAHGTRVRFSLPLAA